MNRYSRLLWVDLETTGLSPQVDEILAVGLQVTDADLNPLATVDWVVNTPPYVLKEKLKGVPREMHAKSGLLNRLERGEGEALSDIFGCLRLTIKSVAPNLKLNHWAGSSVRFDVEFLEAAGFVASNLAHYRLLDVSVFKVLSDVGALGWELPAVDIKHLPLDDIKASQDLYRHVVAKMGTPIHFP